MLCMIFFAKVNLTLCINVLLYSVKLTILPSRFISTLRIFNSKHYRNVPFHDPHMSYDGSLSLNDIIEMFYDDSLVLNGAIASMRAVSNIQCR